MFGLRERTFGLGILMAVGQSGGVRPGDSREEGVGVEICDGGDGDCGRGGCWG